MLTWEYLRKSKVTALGPGTSKPKVSRWPRGHNRSNQQYPLESGGCGTGARSGKTKNSVLYPIANYYKNVFDELDGYRYYKAVNIHFLMIILKINPDRQE